MHRTPTLARRKFLAYFATAIAAATLAACGYRPSNPTEGTAATPSPLTAALPADTPPPPAPTPAAAAPTSPILPTPTAALTVTAIPPIPTSAPATVAPPSPVPTRRVGTATGIVTLPAPPGPGTIVDVTQYGAAGDGATDDTAAIQAAIDAVPAAGGTVMFPPGT